MADVAAAAPKAKATKAKKAGDKKPASHPTYQAMIKAAIKGLSDKAGSSKQAIFKYILEHYKVGDNQIQINSRLRLALKRGVKGGFLTQPKGTGANGRFRLSESKKATSTAKPKKTVKKSKVEKKTKASPAKPKSPKKKTATKKAAAKPKSPKKAKSPKKKAAPAKKAAKPKSPKKAKAPKAKKAAAPKKA